MSFSNNRRKVILLVNDKVVRLGSINDALVISKKNGKLSGGQLDELNKGELIIIGANQFPVMLDLPGADTKIKYKHEELLRKREERAQRIVAKKLAKSLRSLENNRKVILILNKNLTVREKFTEGAAKFASAYGLKQGTVKAYLSKGHKFSVTLERNKMIYCYEDNYDAYLKARGVILPEVDKPDPNQLKIEFKESDNKPKVEPTSKIAKILPELIKKGYTVDFNGTVKNPGGIIVVGSIIQEEGLRKFGVRTESNSSYPIRVHKLQAYIKYGDKIFEKGCNVIHLNGNTLDNSYDNIALSYSKKTSIANIKKKGGGVPAHLEKEIISDREHGFSYRRLVKKYRVPKTTLIDFFKRLNNSPKHDAQVIFAPASAPLFDVDREDLYQHNKPELRERTRKRLIEMQSLGMEEVGYANFGIKGVVSGLLIEKVWRESDREFMDYMNWTKKIIQDKTQASNE